MKTIILSISMIWVLLGQNDTSQGTMVKNLQVTVTDDGSQPPPTEPIKAAPGETVSWSLQILAKHKIKSVSVRSSDPSRNPCDPTLSHLNTNPPSCVIKPGTQPGDYPVQTVIVSSCKKCEVKTSPVTIQVQASSASVDRGGAVTTASNRR